MGLNALYFKESDENLIDFVGEIFGEKSNAGKVIKVKIEQSVDAYDYYARKLQLGHNDGYMNRVFVATFDDGLGRIHRMFDKMNYGQEQTMIEWIDKMHKGDKYAAFLIKMLQNCAD